MRKGTFKPARMVATTSKITVYEDFLVRVLASKCGFSRSHIVRIALLMLLGKVLDNNSIRRSLPPGYENVLRQLSIEAEEEFSKCVTLKLQQ